MSKKNKFIRIIELGVKSYKEGLKIQEELFQQTIDLKINNRRKNIHIPTNNYLLWVEHTPVITLGKSGKSQHLLLSEKQLQEKNIEFFTTNRGGDITFHGPGQIVGYPIFDLDNFFNDIGRYLRCLEECIILTIKEYGIIGGRSEGETGVWIDVGKPNARKICALGVKTSRWVSMHGFAFNINTDLSYFENIIPCGINDKQVTSIQKEVGEKINIEKVKKQLKSNIELVFDLKIL